MEILWSKELWLQMIEKILDKYYIKKMKIFIDRIMIMYALDYRYIDKGDN